MGFALEFKKPGDAEWRRGLVFVSRESARVYRARAVTQARKAGVPVWRYRIKELRP